MIEHVLRSEDSSRELVLRFYCVGSRDQMQVTGHGSKHLYHQRCPQPSGWFVHLVGCFYGGTWNEFK